MRSDYLNANLTLLLVFLLSLRLLFIFNMNSWFKYELLNQFVKDIYCREFFNNKTYFRDISKQTQ